MFVEITNLTDGPGQTPENIDLYSKTLAPGESIKIPAELVDQSLRRLAEGARPKICIGQAPSWYLASKIRRGKELSPEELQRRAKARAAQVAPPAPPASPPPSNVVRLELHDELELSDKVSMEKRGRSRKGGQDGIG